MNAPYIPGGWQSRFNRQISRFLARDRFDLDLDHGIVSISFDDFPKSAATVGATSQGTAPTTDGAESAPTATSTPVTRCWSWKTLTVSAQILA